MNPVSREGSVGRVVDGTVPDVGAVHRATQVEVDCIAAQTESLPHKPYLGMFDSRDREEREGLNICISSERGKNCSTHLLY